MLALERGEKVQLPPAIWFRRAAMSYTYEDTGSDFPGNEPRQFVANLPGRGSSK